MTRGRKPLSSVEMEARGAFDRNPQRRNTKEPKPEPGRPVKPRHVTGIAAKKWDHLCGVLDDLGVLNQTDSDLMEVYCLTYQKYREALSLVDKHGHMMSRKRCDDDGEYVEYKRNPACADLNQMTARLQSLVTEFGLSPSSRRRIESEQFNEGNPLKEFGIVG